MCGTTLLDDVMLNLDNGEILFLIGFCFFVIADARRGR